VEGRDDEQLDCTETVKRSLLKRVPYKATQVLELRTSKQCILAWQLELSYKPTPSHAWYIVGSCGISWDARGLSYSGVPPRQ
jgi:hypothetical protein